MAPRAQKGDGPRLAGKRREEAVIVFSGGMDSVCYASHLKKRYDLYGITFSYGQKAGREIRTAKRFARTIGLKKHKVVDIGFMKGLYGDTNVLTSPRKRRIPGAFEYSIVVPIRNAVFLTVAAAWAYTLDAPCIAYGAHTGDVHYPDCRPGFAKRIQGALNEGEADGIRAGIRRPIRVLSPYIEGYSKSDLVRLGYGNLGAEIFKTWSCYADGTAHCGRCESCNNRRAAFEVLDIRDKTRYLD